MDDLQEVLPQQRMIWVELQNDEGKPNSKEEVLVRQIRVGKLPLIMPVAMPFVEFLRPQAPPKEQPKTSADLMANVGKPVVEGKVDAVKLFMSHTEECLQLIAVVQHVGPVSGLAKTREWVDRLEIDSAMSLFLEIVEANLTFFIRNVLPMVTAMAGRLSAIGNALKRSDGLT